MIPLALKLEPGAESRAPMAVVVIGGLLSSTLLAVLVTPSLYTLLDDLQRKLFRPARVAAVPKAAMAEPTPVPVAAGASGVATVSRAGRSSNGHGLGNVGQDGVDGHNGANGHRSEPLWLQKLKAGVFEEND
jgi:hypothetical protein